MTGATGSASASHGAPAARRCPACGQPLGDRPVEMCPLCSFKIGDARPTGADVTPYAVAFENDEARVLPMCRWVWTAGPQRLKHLAMMRSSPASRKFALLHVLVLTIALGVLRATTVGWRFVSFAEASTGSVVRPAGRGWFRIAPPAGADGGDVTAAGLWWNPAPALLGGALALVAALVLIAFARRLIRFAVETAHARPYRGEERMTAAQCYATAWIFPITAAVVILWFRPIPAVAGGTATSAHDLIFLLPAGILSGAAMIFGWFWLLRLAATSPADTRGPVTVALTLGVPAILVACAAGWWFALEKLLLPLFNVLKMGF